MKLLLILFIYLKILLNRIIFNLIDNNIFIKMTIIYIINFLDKDIYYILLCK